MPCGAAAQVRLRFEIEGVRSARGNLTITVYGDDPAEFLAPGARLARIRVPSQGGILKACMAVPPRRSYAVAVYHDEDGDHDFDRTLLGLPDEGFGFSRNPETIFGIPGYDSVKFEAGIGDTAVAVRLRYP